VEPAEINIHMSSFFGGGAEMSMIRLANYWKISGRRRVRFVVNLSEGPVGDRLAPGIEVVSLGERRTRHAVFRLRSWLVEQKPELLVSVLPAATIAAAMAVRLSSRETAHAALVRNFTSVEFSHKGVMRRELMGLAFRTALRSADAVGCVSGAVARDVKDFAGIPEDRLWTTFNPVPMPEEAPTGPVIGWPADADHVLVAAGRLGPQKDYPTLLRALAQARSEVNADLVILGDGPLRDEIGGMIAGLNLGGHVHMPGYAANVPDYIARSDAFILTSRFEGFPNVLAEALALGKTAIATDAPGGSAEILGEGKYGYLAPVGDDAAIARLIVRALREPIDPGVAKRRAEEFDTASIALRYEQAFDGAVRRRRERSNRGGLPGP
jgi:glycosyltransferase involved in cell wall biosynthesis